MQDRNMSTATATWQERVEAEAEELDVRLSKLSAFVDTPEYDELSVAMQMLLLMQTQGMTVYRTALGLRLEVDEEDKG